MNNSVRTTKQSHWQHKNNVAKNGFFPTDREIVEMEMSKINFLGLEDNTNVPICDLTGGTGDQLYWMYNYIQDEGLNPVAYYNEIDKSRFENCENNYGNLPNWNMQNTDLFKLKIRNTEGKRYSEKVFAVCRNNPPYMYIEIGGKSKRFEEESIIKNSRYIVPGGIMIFEVPIHQLIEHKSMLQRLTYRFEDINIFKFPKEQFKKFKQVVVFAKKKKLDSNDGEVANELHEMLLQDKVTFLDEHEGYLYSLSQEKVNMAKKVTVYRDGRVNNVTLSNGFYSVIDTLVNKEEKNKVKKAISGNSKPIIKQLPGHMAVRFAAGDFNGVLGGKVLVNGTSIKEEIVEGDREENVKITETIEIYKPQVEVVSSNGDYILKKY